MIGLCKEYLVQAKNDFYMPSTGQCENDWCMPKWFIYLENELSVPKPGPCKNDLFMDKKWLFYTKNIWSMQKLTDL